MAVKNPVTCTCSKQIGRTCLLYRIQCSRCQ